MNDFTIKPWLAARANDVDALIPEYWANESILLLNEEMVAAGLVHRDFSDEVAEAGDTVNTQKPSTFVGKRKIDSEDVTSQDVTETNIAVVLNQHLHVSFTLKDGEVSKSFKDLVTRYLAPAMSAQARFVDQCLLGQATQFLANTSGGLGLLSASTAHNHLVETREKLNNQKAYPTGRNLVLGSSAEARMLETDLFISAERMGDGGAAMREAHLGRKFGLNTFMDLNAAGTELATADTATTMAAAAAKGATSLSVTASIAVGTYFTVAGDMTPLLCSAVTGSGPYTVTVTRGLKEAVASGAVVTPYVKKLVDLGAGYAAGWHKEIHIDGAGADPHVGQLVTFTDDEATDVLFAGEYTIMQVTNTAGDDWDIILDRPLETAMADGDIVGLGPNGGLNMAFHRNALALVMRPLALPIPGTGARAALASHNGVAMRVVITYNGTSQGHLVTLDTLFGVKTLDTDLGVVQLS